MILESHENAVTDALGLQQALTKLTEREQTIINGLYYLDKTHAELGVELQLPTRAVKNLEAGALLRLRSVFHND